MTPADKGKEKKPDSKRETFFCRILDRFEKAVKRIPRWVLIVFFAVLPALVTLLLVTFALHSSISHFAPVAYNDTTEYWLEIAAFNKAGFNGGYFSYMQTSPAVTIFHFGVHGPVYATIIGTISKLIGWNYDTQIYLNMALIGLAFILFAWLRKLDQMQIIIAGVAVITCWPVLMFIPSAYQESFQQAGGILIAGIFGHALIKGNGTSLWKKIVAVLFILVLGLTRYSWALLLFPLFLLYQPQKKWYTILSICIALVLFGAAVFTVGRISGTGNTLLDALIREFSVSFNNGINYILLQLSANIKMFLQSPYVPIALNRLIYIGLMVFTLIDGIYIYYRVKRKTTLDDAATLRLKGDLTIFLGLFLMIMAAFAFYYMTGDFRLFAPLLLIAFLILVQSKRYKPVLVGIVCSLVVTPFFISTYQAVWSTTFHFNQESLTETHQLLTEYIPYTQGTGNAWCNTIYIPWQLYDYRVAAIPAGIGVSYYYDENNSQLEFPLLARYLWITTEQFEELEPGDVARLRKIVDMPEAAGVPDAYGIIGDPEGGTIYLNLDADCP